MALEFKEHPRDYWKSQQEPTWPPEKETIKGRAGEVFGTLAYNLLKSVCIPKTALSVGCRTGSELRALQEPWPGLEAVGVDISARYCGAVERHGAEFVCADAHALPFEDRSFDVSMCFQTVEHFLDPTLAIHEMLRCTKRFAILSFPLESSEKFQETPEHFVRANGPSDWVAFMEQFPEWELLSLKGTGYIEEKLVHFVGMYYRRGATC